MDVNGGHSKGAAAEEPIIAIGSPELTVRSALQNANWLTSCCGKCKKMDHESGHSDTAEGLEELNDIRTQAKLPNESGDADGDGNESKCLQSPQLSRSKPSKPTTSSASPALNDSPSANIQASSSRTIGTAQVHPTNDEATTADPTEPPLASLEPSQLVAIRISKL